MKRQAVLITGAARRVGATLALHFAENGYDIALHYRRSKSDAVKLKARIEKLGQNCELFSLDLSQTKKLPALMASVKKKMPHCTTLVNNASAFDRAPLMKTTEALFDRQLAVNLKAPFFLTQSFAATFKKASIITILDTDIGKTQGSHFAYLLSKKALADFTLMAARELGPHVRVNGVCPGYVMPNSASDAAYIRKIEKELPLKAHAVPGDVAEAAVWLSRQPRISGQILFVDGGQHVL